MYALASPSSPQYSPSSPQYSPSSPQYSPSSPQFSPSSPQESPSSPRYYPGSPPPYSPQFSPSSPQESPSSPRSSPPRAVFNPYGHTACPEKVHSLLLSLQQNAGQLEKATAYLLKNGAQMFRTRKSRKNLWRALINTTWYHMELGSVEFGLSEAAELCANLANGERTRGYEYMDYYCCVDSTAPKDGETLDRLKRLGFATAREW